MAYNVSNRLVAVNVLLHDTILVDTDGREEIERTLVTGVNTVENQADNNLLPGWASLVPEFGLLEVDNVTDVLHDTVHSTGGQDLVFVVICHSNQKLSVTVVHSRTQIVAVLQCEVVGVACGGRVWHVSASQLRLSKHVKHTSHVGELLTAALEVIAVLCLDGILDGTWHGVVGRKDRALDQLDLTCQTALKAHAAAGLLALFLGSWGIHKFYLGYNTEGAIMLGVTLVSFVLLIILIGFLGLMAIGGIALVEGILYLTKSEEEFHQTYVLRKRPWF